MKINLRMLVLFALGCGIASGCSSSPEAPTTTTTALGVPTVTNTTPLGWTIMVYMCGDNNLEPYALSDMNELEAASTAANIIDIIVLMDRSPLLFYCGWGLDGDAAL